MPNPKPRAGMVYRMSGTNKSEWAFSDETRYDAETHQWVAMDPHPVQNADRLEQFYQAWLTLHELAKETHIDVNARPDLIVRHVLDEIEGAYERGIQEGASRPEKYLPDGAHSD